MAFGTTGYDIDQTNQALQTLGSSYQVPAQQPAAQAAPPAAPTAYAAPQARDPEVAGVQTPDGGSDIGATLNAAQGAIGAADSMQGSPEKKENNGMDKLGALIGTVASVYTGNYAGAASGVQSMSEEGKK